MCIGMYNMHWYVLVCVVCNGLYWYVFACNGTNGIVHIDENWFYLCVLLCFGMYCMYKRYLYILVSISQYLPYCTPKSMYYWHILRVFVCICLFWCVLLCIFTYCMYQYVSCELTCSTTGMYIDMFARIDLKVFACIGLHCVHWPVLLVVVCIDKGASVDWYHFIIHAKDLHNTYQYLHNTCILVQCYTAFRLFIH